MDVKYPGVHVRLTGQDGNGFMIIGRVRKALKRAGVASSEIEAFTKEAQSGDYDNLLQTVMRTVETS